MYFLFATLALLYSPDQFCPQSQGIKGSVYWIRGNQMPGPNKPAIQPTGIQREIWIYEVVSIDDVKSDGVFFSYIPTQVVKKLKCNSNGRFKVKLPPGEYSLFVKEEKGLFANQFDSQNRINCVVVKPKEFTEITILVNYEAAY